MSLLLMLRHGVTDWNVAGRIQGRSDIPLDDAGRAQVRAWRIPPAFGNAMWLVSPLARARETAALLGAEDARIEPDLVEMSWGRFEGRTLADLRTEDPDGMAANEARGLDFLPPEGESPRMVRTRLSRLLTRLDPRCESYVAVCHKGVMRAALSIATGWDFTGKPPCRLGRDDGLRLRLREGGRLDLLGTVDLKGKAG